MLIVISGTPGTGKTTSAEVLGKIIDARVIHLKEFAMGRKISSGFDRKMDSGIVDLEKLKMALLKEIKMERNDLIIEGHLACEIMLPAKYVFVLRCKPDQLKKRMEKRKYAKEKIEGNILAELLDYCTQKAQMNYPRSRIFELETSGKTAPGSAHRMNNIISGNGKGDNVDYQKQLKEYLKLK